MPGRQPHPPTASITLRLDRWASLLRNEWGHEHELEDLSILCTEAANVICDLSAENRRLRDNVVPSPDP